MFIAFGIQLNLKLSLSVIKWSRGEGVRGSGGIAPPLLNSALDGGER
jgi:hypothetical protein